MVYVQSSAISTSTPQMVFGFPGVLYPNRVYADIPLFDGLVPFGEQPPISQYQGLDALDFVDMDGFAFSTDRNGMIFTPSGPLVLLQNKVYYFDTNDGAVTPYAPFDGLNVQNLDALTYMGWVTDAGVDDGEAWAFSVSTPQVLFEGGEALVVYPSDILCYFPATDRVVIQHRLSGIGNVDALDFGRLPVPSATTASLGSDTAGAASTLDRASDDTASTRLAPPPPSISFSTSGSNVVFSAAGPRILRDANMYGVVSTPNGYLFPQTYSGSNRGLQTLDAFSGFLARIEIELP
ncbi:MAG: hypothetical protein GY716_00470 [bacterium]|nr:hypothetical protein [bacterium]